MAFDRRLAVLALLILTGATSVACSTSSSDDEELDEGELGWGGDNVMESVLGEASKGPTLPPNFSSLSATEKQQVMWRTATQPRELRCRLTASTIAGEALVSALRTCPVGSGADDLREPTLLGTLGRTVYGAGLGAFTKLVEIVGGVESGGLLSPAFDAHGDEMPKLRKKLFHPFGSIAAVELRVDASSPIQKLHPDFTGLLTPGARVPGIARLSSGGPESIVGSLPGLGLKLFVSGGPSADVHAIHKVTGQTLPDGKTPDHNYFRNALSNEIIQGNMSASVRAAQALFSKIHSPPNHLPVDHLGVTDVDGRVARVPRSPWHLAFEAPAGIKAEFQAVIDADPSVDPRVAMAVVTKDATAENPVVLFRLREASAEALASTAPDEIESKYPTFATLVATTPFLPSKWGDSQLYVRHNRGCIDRTDGKYAKGLSPCRR